MTKKNTVILLEYLSQYQPMMYDSLCKKASRSNIIAWLALFIAGIDLISKLLYK